VGLKDAALHDAILSGKLPAKPAQMPDKQWALVQRMSCYNPSERLSAPDVVRELEVFTEDDAIRQQELQEDFAYLAPPSWEVLDDAEIPTMVSAA
jgi:hypothetical protein